MKKLILTGILAAFAVAVQAGDDKSCSDKEGSSCCKAKVSMESKSECPMAKQQAKGTCPMAGKNAKLAVSKTRLESPKASATR
jgi:hypothetical protein